MFTDSYLLSVTLLTGVHTEDSYYKCWVQLLRADSADTSTFVTGKSVMEIEMRPEENSHAWGSWKKLTTAKLSKLSLSVIHQKERFGTAGVIIICVQNTSRNRPLRIYEWNSEGTWNNHRLLMNLLLSWSKGCCWCKKTWHWALPLHHL